jgi:hypothetical protein
LTVGYIRAHDTGTRGIGVVAREFKVRRMFHRMLVDVEQRTETDEDLRRCTGDWRRNT